MQRPFARSPALYAATAGVHALRRAPPSLRFARAPASSCGVPHAATPRVGRVAPLAAASRGACRAAAGARRPASHSGPTAAQLYAFVDGTFTASTASSDPRPREQDQAKRVR
jgi:hypothetical protein